MKHFGFRYVRGQILLDISEIHWWWVALVDVTDGICALSRHRLCNSLVPRVYDLTERHIATLTIPVDREHWVSWAAMTGADDPSWWWDEPEIDQEMPIVRTGTPKASPVERGRKVD